MTMPQDGEYARLAQLAAGMAASYAGYNVLSANGTVHARGDVPWIGDLTRPGPYCHIGVTGKLRRTRHAVTCLRCVQALGLSAEPQRWSTREPIAGLDELLAA